MHASSVRSVNRRWLQFSLRTLLVAMLVVAAYLAGRMPMVRRAELAEQQRDDARQQAEKAHALAQQAQLRRPVTWAPIRAHLGSSQQSRNANPVSEEEVISVREKLQRYYIANEAQQRVPSSAKSLENIDAGMMFDALEINQRWQDQLQRPHVK